MRFSAQQRAQMLAADKRRKEEEAEQVAARRARGAEIRRSRKQAEAEAKIAQDAKTAAALKVKADAKTARALADLEASRLRFSTPPKTPTGMSSFTVHAGKAPPPTLNPATPPTARSSPPTAEEFKKAGTGLHEMTPTLNRAAPQSPATPLRTRNIDDERFYRDIDAKFKPIVLEVDPPTPSASNRSVPRSAPGGGVLGRIVNFVASGPAVSKIPQPHSSYDADVIHNVKSTKFRETWDQYMTLRTIDRKFRESIQVALATGPGESLYEPGGRTKAYVMNRATIYKLQKSFPQIAERIENLKTETWRDKREIMLVIERMLELEQFAETDED